MALKESTRRSLLGAIGGSLVLAGCVGGDDDNGDENGGGDGGDSSTENGDGGSAGDDDGAENGGDNDTDSGDMDAAAVTVASHDRHGDILVGPDEMTLYMFDRDEQGAGESACSGGCADSWPPLTVDGEPAAGDGVDAELTTFERDDGATQVAANGWPLYYFVNDEAPGDTAGQAVNDVWWVLNADGTPIRGNNGSDGDGGNGDENGDDGGGGYG